MTKFVGKNWNSQSDNLTASNTNTLANLPLGKYKLIDNKSPTIFIIDDSITVRELLAITFTKAGYKVVLARDGRDAWEQLKVGLVCDFILSDIEMPRMDGLELLSKVKEDEKLKDIPFAFMTSRGTSRMRLNNWWDERIVARFTKPYIEKNLLETVANTLKILPEKKEETLAKKITNKPPTILIKENINSGKLRKYQTRFFVVGFNLEQRKQLVTLFGFKPNLFCHFFPENKLINPDADKFDAQLLISQLEERIIKDIGALSKLKNFYNFSNIYNCTFIPDNLLNYFAEISDNSSSCSVYLLIHINVLKSLDQLNLKALSPQFLTIVIDDKNQINALSSDFLKQLQQDWNTKAYINLKQPNILETFASVVNGKAPIEKQIKDKESKELNEELTKIFLDFEESQKIMEKEKIKAISDEELIQIFLDFDK